MAYTDTPGPDRVGSVTGVVAPTELAPRGGSFELTITYEDGSSEVVERKMGLSGFLKPRVNDLTNNDINNPAPRGYVTSLEVNSERVQNKRVRRWDP